MASTDVVLAHLLTTATVRAVSWSAFGAERILDRFEAARWGKRASKVDAQLTG